MTNNQAEYMALWQGLELVSHNRLRHLKVFGDSKILIQQVNKCRKKEDPWLPPVLHRIKLLIEQLDTIEFYHIKRHLNEEADFVENHGVLLNPKKLRINDEGTILKPLP